MGKLEIKNVTKIYKTGKESLKALDDINLKIEDGEFVAIVGQSGSGKSTLMNIMGCLDTPTCGEYYIDNKEISKINSKELSKVRNKKIGFIFQGFNLISTLTAEENTELPLIYRGLKKSERKKLSIEALETVGLMNRIYHKPSELSGGQQQRVAIARAVAANPEILLADEPTGNLDSKSGAEIMDLLKSINKKGKTLVMITHDLSLVKNANRIIRIHDGKMAEY